jgi:hypothetical protein
MRKESKCPRGVYKVKSFGTLHTLSLAENNIYYNSFALFKRRGGLSP